MRYHVRAKLPNGQPVINKVTADNAYAAVTAALAELRGSEHAGLASQVTEIRVRVMENAKSTVYVGKVPDGTSKRGFGARKSAAPENRPAETPAAAPAPAKPAAAAAKK